MKLAKLGVRSDAVAKHRSDEKSISPVLRLRLLMDDLIQEVESLDQRLLSSSEVLLLENGNSVNFYHEVERFERALIISALRRANGHQLNAARLLNLNPTTLNNKIKQYHINKFLT